MSNRNRGPQGSNSQPKQTEVAKAVSEETKPTDTPEGKVETPTEASPQVVEGVGAGNAEELAYKDPEGQKNPDEQSNSENDAERSKLSPGAEEAQQAEERGAQQATAQNEVTDRTKNAQVGSEEHPDAKALSESEKGTANKAEEPAIEEQKNDEPAALETEQESDEPPFDFEGAKKEHGLPEAWTDEQVNDWVNAGGEAAGKTESGVLKVNPERDGQPFVDWSTEELLAGLKGELDLTENKLGALLKVYRTRAEVPDAWTFRQALDFFREGVEPEKTEEGVWVIDNARNDKVASSWSTAELEAWGGGKIKATGKANDQKLALELKSRLHLNPKNNSPEEVKASYKQSTGSNTEGTGVARTATASSKPTDQQPDKGLTSMNQTFIDATLERYATILKPGNAVTEAVGGSEQRKLETMFQYVISLPEPQSVAAGLDRIVAFVKENRDGLFSASHAHRFKHMLRGENGERDRHTNFIELLRIYTDDNKEVRKQADLRHLLKRQPADKQELLVEYFKQLK